MEQTLVLTPATRASIAHLSHRAHQQPYPTHHLKRLFRQPLPERSLVVPHGYRLTFTVGQFRPGWACRHLAVVGPKRWPTPEAVAALMRLFEFKNEMSECLTWPGGPLGSFSVNVLEPCDGKNWTPLRSA
jgi:hypothetical protein